MPWPLEEPTPQATGITSQADGQRAELGKPRDLEPQEIPVLICKKGKENNLEITIRKTSCGSLAKF